MHRSNFLLRHVDATRPERRSSRLVRYQTALSLVLAGLLSSANPLHAEMVQFELDQPGAKQVYLAGEMTHWEQGKKPMHRDADGKWRLGVDLAPGQWVYKFIVDGKWIADPAGAQHDADGQGGLHSFVFSGNGPWRTQPAIPKGRVETVSVASQAWARPMKVNVYLPPRFSAGKPYPVLLLLHGRGMDADQWYKTGQIQNYMDNLIAAHEIEPFVVVMPSSADVYYVDQSERHITEELPRWLQARYGLTLEPGRTAVAGMSMGGFGAVALPLRHPEMFGMGFSLSGYFPPERNAAMALGKVPSVKLVIVTGADDEVTASNRKFVDLQKPGAAPFYYREDAGGHTWNFWSKLTAEMFKTVATYFATGRVPANQQGLTTK